MKHAWSIVLLVCLAGCKSTSNLTVVSDFDVSAYLGTWYEAARYPHRFEKGLNSVSATYSLNNKGTIKVENRGFNDKKQKWEDIEGVAKFKDTDDRGWLKVSFFKPFYASYKIIYLDEAYSKAIVTGPSYGYLWILVRNPSLPKEELSELIDKAEKLGFDPEKLIIVDQSRNKS
jgi:apolipoprotein D and lipocalin family protein